ncbi:MAG: hypothetical protein WC517_02480 [Patescibacteria group bacterium]
MERKQANYYLRRIYRLLKNNEVPIILKKIRSTRGITDAKTIWLNPQNDILLVIIHECLHVLYWSWSETKVTKSAVKIFNQLTPRQMKNLLLRLALAVNKIPTD